MERREEALEEGHVLFATLTIERFKSAPVVDHGTFRRWLWLATMEKRLVEHSDWRQDTDLVARRYRVLEVRDVP
jgi:hypothetical protein